MAKTHPRLVTRASACWLRRLLVDHALQRRRVPCGQPDRPLLSRRRHTHGLIRGDDGSLPIVASASPPTETDVNWLPAPTGSFSLVLRVYDPRHRYSTVPDHHPQSRRSADGADDPVTLPDGCPRPAKRTWPGARTSELRNTPTPATPATWYRHAPRRSRR